VPRDSEELESLVVERRDLIESDRPAAHRNPFALVEVPWLHRDASPGPDLGAAPDPPRSAPRHTGVRDAETVPYVELVGLRVCVRAATTLNDDDVFVTVRELQRYCQASGTCTNHARVSPDFCTERESASIYERHSAYRSQVGCAAMNTVQLGSTQLTPTVVGFGTVGGSLTLAERVEMYERAFELGIRHFDTARVYSFGDAESILGRFLAGRRDSVTVTTKFGLAPPTRLIAHRSLLRLARPIAKIAPSAVGRAKMRVAGRVSSAGRFSPADARDSLHASLRALGTDYVDIFLLHECAATDITEELLRVLEELVQDGKVRASGIATGPEDSRIIAAMTSPFPSVIQTSPRLSVHEEPGGLGIIIHSTIASRMAAVRTHCFKDEGSSIELEALCGVSPRDESAFAAMLFSSEVAIRKHGPVLFSSAKPDHLSRNISALDSVPADADRFLRAVDALIAP
jgi:D-threo-aldose 1-dehydrogenase